MCFVLCFGSYSPRIWSILTTRFCYSRSVLTLNLSRCLDLNGTIVLRGRLTVCLELVWVIRWPVPPFLNLVKPVMTHSFHDVVFFLLKKKKGPDTHSGCQTKINLFSVERQECSDKRVSARQCVWRNIWTTFPERSYLGHLCGQPPQNPVSNTHNNAGGYKERNEKHQTATGRLGFLSFVLLCFSKNVLCSVTPPHWRKVQSGRRC